MNDKAKKLIKVMILIVIALLSVFVVSKYASSPEFHTNTIEALDEKKTTVMELTAASTAASAAITLIPGDTATPIADKLADLSSCFLIVLCAIYLEKYLVTITGFAAFTILIPAACVLFALHILSKNNIYKYLARKLAVFGLAIVLVIPASVQVSNLIEATYEESINNTIESAKETTDAIEESAEISEEEEGFWQGIASKLGSGVSAATTKVEHILNDFLESLAIMLVTSCVIPILVMLFFAWIIKMVLGINVNIPMGIPAREKYIRE